MKYYRPIMLNLRKDKKFLKIIKRSREAGEPERSTWLYHGVDNKGLSYSCSYGFLLL